MTTNQQNYLIKQLKTMSPEERETWEAMERDHRAMEAARKHRRLSPGAVHTIGRVGLEDGDVGREMDSLAAVFRAALGEKGCPMASDIDKAVADLRAECEALREENGQLETLRDEEHERANKAESDAAELRSENAELRRERDDARSERDAANQREVGAVLLAMELTGTGCEAVRETARSKQLNWCGEFPPNVLDAANARADALRSKNAELRRERDRVCVLLHEAGQDGIDIGDTGGCEWSAETFAGVIKRKMADFAEVRSAALPDEDPEDLAGPYGDGFDAATGALDLLCEQRDHANARAEAAEAREAELRNRLTNLSNPVAVRSKLGYFDPGQEWAAGYAEAMSRVYRVVAGEKGGA